MVAKFVRVPPSQRSMTKNWPLSLAVCLMAVCACFFVPTNSTLLPLRTMLAMKSQAASNWLIVLLRSMMWMPLRASKMNGFILGFHRFVWCPKWTPASSNSLTPILITIFLWLEVRLMGEPSRGTRD